MENKQKYDKDPLNHLIDGVYTKQEAKDALELLRDEKNDATINQHMSEVWHQIQESSKVDIFEYNADAEQAEKLLKQINKLPFYKKYIKHFTVAASIIILLGIGAIGHKYYNIIKNSNLEYTEISTSYGEIKEITLPDGSVAILNACSSLSYPEKFTEDRREITLEGEAYFQVAKNEGQPFIVNTKNFDVSVLGTVFNVRAYQGDQIQSVNVESGRVQVDMPEAMARLSGDEQIEINTLADSYSKDKSDYKDVAAWRKGSLRFSKTPVEDVAKQLERVYNCKIVFEGKHKFNNLISGEHDNESLHEVLESIRLASEIKWKTDKNTQKIILYR